MGPGNKSQRQKKGPWNLGGREGRKPCGVAVGGAVGGSVGVLHREPLQSAVYVTDLCKVLDVSEVQVTV